MFAVIFLQLKKLIKKKKSLKFIDNKNNHYLLLYCFFVRLLDY